MNGGGNCYVVRIGQDADPAGRRRAAPGPRSWPPAPTAQIGRLKATAIDPAVQPGDVSVRGHRPGRRQPGPRTCSSCVVKRQAARWSRSSTGPASRKGKQNVVTMVNAVSKLINLEDTSSGAVERLPNGETALAAPARAAALPSTRLSADDYVGDVAERTGFAGLEAVEEITMLCVPDLMSAYQQGAIDLDTVQAVQTAMIAHCELMGDRVAILDAAARLQRPADQGVAGRQGALRLDVRDPLLAVDPDHEPG